jgi:hypothetical protein
MLDLRIPLMPQQYLHPEGSRNGLPISAFEITVNGYKIGHVRPEKNPNTDGASEVSMIQAAKFQSPCSSIFKQT